MTNDLIKKIHSVINEKSLLKHPFYQAWNCGELPIESMRKYAEQYYHFEKAYPRFLSNVHSTRYYHFVTEVSILFIHQVATKKGLYWRATLWNPTGSVQFNANIWANKQNVNIMKSKTIKWLRPRLRRRLFFVLLINEGSVATRWLKNWKRSKVTIS